MSEKLFKFLLSELAVVRIHCKASNCDGIVETPIIHLQTKYFSGLCPLCQTQLLPDSRNGLNSLAKLCQAITDLVKRKHEFEVEFVLPDQSANQLQTP
jgi:hypothetical protein